MGALPRGGGAGLGAVEAEAAGQDARDMDLPGTQCCSSGSDCGQDSGPDTTQGGADNGESHHILRQESGEAFPVHIVDR